MDEDDTNPELFKDVRYYAVGTLDTKLRETLTKRKAKAESYLTSLVTHAIVVDPTRYEAEEAQELWQIPTVTVNWVEKCVLCNKILPTKGFLSTTTQLFSNCNISFSGLSKNDKEQLWGLVTFHGGKCQSKLNKDVSHLVVATTSGAKYEQALKHDVACVTPDWITDSVKKKEKQDVTAYHPKLNIVPKPKEAPKEKLPDEVSQAVKEMSVADTAGKMTVTSTEMKTSTGLQPDSGASVTSKQASMIPSSVKSPGSAGPPKPNQSTTPTRQPLEPPFSPNNPNMMQQMRYGAMPNQMFRQGTPSSNPRIFFASHPMHSPMAPNQSMMMSSTMTSQTFQTPPAQQGFSMMSPNQMMMSSGGQPPQMMMQQQTMSPNNQPFMSPPPRSTSGSPRRNSGSQTPGSKKKKAGGGQANRVSPHATIRQVHPMGQGFQQKPGQPQFSPQQQMMLKGKVPGAMDPGGMVNQQMMPKMGEAGAMKPRMGMRPGMMQPGRFPGGGDFQGMQHQQMMLQMQQQQMRMSMMNQTSPGAQSAPHPGDPMQQKWPRAGMDPNFPGDQHQAMFPGQQQSPNFSQGQMLQQQGHQFMMNRMPGQPSTQQQFMFRERSPGGMNVNRFPTTSSLEAAGIAGISPIALQQGLMNSQHQDQPALIHPSLQGTLFPKVPSTQQSGGSAPKKRTKSRKKTETGEEETKPKSRQRTTKAKKPQVPTTPTTPHMQPQVEGPQQGIPQQPHFHPQGVMTSQVMMTSPGGHPYMGQNPPQFAPNQAQPPMMTQTHPGMQIRPSMISTNQQPPMSIMQKMNAAPMVAESISEQAKQNAETTELRGQLVDPLLCEVKEIDEQFAVREPTEKVPPELFLLGCIFYICEYEEVLNDISVMSLWKKMIQKYGGVVEESYLPICTHVICVTATTPVFRQAISDRKRCVTVYWLNDVLQLRTLKVPWLAIHLPTVFPLDNKPAAKHTISYSGFHAKERERLKMMAFVCGAKFTGFFSRSNTALVCKRTKSAKMEKAKEWRIPCVTLRWLRDSLHSVEPVDMLQTKYQKFDDDSETSHGLILDFSKTKNFLEAWKMKIHVSPESLSKSQVKRKLESIPQSPTPAKCARPSETYQALPRVCFTGFAPITVKDLSKKIIALNGRVETTLTLCTHLVSSHVSRTVKFLSCISSCSHVVTPEWIDESFKVNWLLDEEKFHLVDKNAEMKFNFSLQETIKRARKAPLFKDCLFAITQKVVPDRNTLKQIIECASGKVLSKMPSLAVIKHVHSRANPHSQLFIISCPDDEGIYLPLKKEGISVHNAEIVLTGVLRQEIVTNMYRL
uniref:PAX-interacting protein 1 n=1 Tax=Phallusia mammillata TaxID=59560 RepID=A0A6F9DNW0_9ASCI|nr:PAX-interacting protein 1-like [Phallusia mammillata]